MVGGMELERDSARHARIQPFLSRPRGREGRSQSIEVLDVAHRVWAWRLHSSRLFKAFIKAIHHGYSKRLNL